MFGGTLKSFRAVAATMGALLGAGMMTVMATPSANAGDVQTEATRTSLIIEYTVTATCDVYPNYPKAGVVMNTPWQINPGDIVGWRYNVSADPNSTYAMVSDRKYRTSDHPWWGFVKRTCIGTSTGTDSNGNPQHYPTLSDNYPAGQPVPSRQLEGRSQSAELGYWRPVDFSPAAGSSAGNVTVKSNGTLRDYPNRFVIGNVLKTQVLHPTHVHKLGWTFVYAPDALRWGWVQDIHIPQ